jgi:hypothetical protein
LILEDLGWKLLRIWSTDYFLDPVRIINEIDQQLNEFLEDYRMAKAEEEKEEPEEELNEGEDPQELITPTEVNANPEKKEELDFSSSPESIDAKVAPLDRKEIKSNPYIHYSGPKCSDPHFCNESEIRERLLDIIEEEGPMFVEVAYKSYLRSAGIQKLGRQIRKLLNKNLEWVLNSGLVEKEQELEKEGFLGVVVRSSDSAKAVIRAKGPRELVDIPPSELKLVAQEMYGENFQRNNESYRRILSFYGISKLTNKSKEILESAFL